MKTVLLLLIRFYQLTLSSVMGRRCRFLPTCSDYARQAIEIHGPVRGEQAGGKADLPLPPLGRRRL